MQPIKIIIVTSLLFMNRESVENIKFFGYCRKSSEAEDKQVQSNEAQEDDLMAMKEREGLTVNELFKESQSAHYPGRPVFKDVVKRIEKGEANGLLVWHANRISRNPIDSGTIIYLLDTGKLKAIKTPGRTYYNTPDDKFFLQLEFSVSKKDSDDKSEAVKRGFRKKASKGLPHGVACIGYLNDKSEEKGNRKWMVDAVRFPLAKRLREMFLSGRYSVRQLWVIARDEMKLTTPQRKRQGGRAISLSYLYTMLADPIAAGFFFYEGKRYALDEELPRMISEDDYWQIQTMLGKKGRPKPQKRSALYSHFLTCAECHGPTSADFKFQLICSACKLKFSYPNRDACPRCHINIAEMNDPTYLSYVFYYCLNRKKKRTNCSGMGVNERRIDAFIQTHLRDEVSISKPLADWCMQNLRELDAKEENDSLANERSQQAAEQALEKKLDRLLDLRLGRDNLTPEEEKTYDNKEAQLRKELVAVRKRHTRRVSIEQLDQPFSLMSEILNTFEHGTLEDKKEALHEFRSNLTFSSEKVSIYHTNEVSTFIECLKLARAENSAFEPKNIVDFSKQNGVFNAVRPILLRGLENVRTLMKIHPVVLKYAGPNLK